MSESIVTSLVLAFSALTLVGFVSLTIIVVRRLPQNQPKPENREVIAHPPDNPVSRLSFTNSFDPDLFAIASEQSAVSHLNDLLRTGVGDGIVLTVNGVRLLPSSAEMIVSISRDGQKLLEQGKAVIARHLQSGRRLPILRDARTGEFIESFKEAKMATTLSRVGALSAAIIGAAHIISGADIARRLKEVEAKIDLLIVYRRIDQMATLERIYTAARELISGPLGSEERWELWRLRNELRELRLAWRREFQHHLNLIEDPRDAGWVYRMFTWKKASDQKIHSRITDAQINVTLMEYSMRLDHVLAAIGGTLDKFEITLADELFDLDELAKLLQSKANLISGRYQEVTVEPTVKVMTEIVQQYRTLLPDTSSPIGGATQEATTTKEARSSLIQERT